MTIKITPIETAQALNILLRNQAEKELQRFHAKRRLAETEFYLLSEVNPAALGTNDESRKIGKMRLLREDEAWSRYEFEVAECDRALITINMEIECQKNIRRAQEKYVEAVAVGVGDAELEPAPEDFDGNDL